MNLKKSVKKLLGNQNADYVKGSLKLLKSKRLNMNVLQYNDNYVDNIKLFSAKGFNVFCGYYDYFPLSEDKKLLLCQRVKKRASTKKDFSEIGYYIISENRFIPIAKSYAWCWQQGSRLHWSYQNCNNIWFNDYDGKKYCTRIFDMQSNKIVKNIYPALYDVSFDEHVGATLNFSRLQRLRPGYGYDRIPDSSKDEKAPSNDGLFKVDLVNECKTLLVSLKELSKDVDPLLKHDHYINHISFSPNGKKIMFFHLWTEDKWPGWMTRLCVYNIEEGNYDILENEKMVSHYDWMGNSKLLITGADKITKKAYYALYDLNTKERIFLNQELLKEDGHPTIDDSLEFFLSDTYPDSNFNQHVFIWNFKTQERINILDVFSDPRLTGEYRCDLHPKYKDGVILIDVTHLKCLRSIIMFDLKK